MAWSTPAIVVAAAAPATAASRDIVVAKAGCYDPAVGSNTLAFTVTAVGATLAAGSTIQFSYSGGNSYPTWTGSLPSMANVSENRQGSTLFAGAYGTVTFQLRQDLTAGQTATVTCSYRIGPAAQQAQATLAVTSGLIANGNGVNNLDSTNDSASYNIGRGSCNN